MKVLIPVLIVLAVLAGCKEEGYPCLVCTGVTTVTTDKPLNNYPVYDSTVYDLCDHPNWEHLLKPFADTSISYSYLLNDTFQKTTIHRSTCVRK